MKAQLKDLELIQFVINEHTYHAAPILEYPNYYASTCGFIISTQWSKPLVRKGLVADNGRLRVGLRKDGRTCKCYVARLVVAAFYTKPHPDYLDRQRDQVNHINGQKTDNRVSNLEWCSRSENMGHYHHVLKAPDFQAYLQQQL